MGVMAAGAAEIGNRVIPSGRHRTCACLSSHTIVLCHDTVAVVLAVARYGIATDYVAVVLSHPEEVAAGMQIMAVVTHNVVRASPPSRCIIMAVEAGGAGVRAQGESRSIQTGSRNWLAVNRVVHGVTAVTGGHTTGMEGQRSGAQAKGDEGCRYEN